MEHYEEIQSLRDYLSILRRRKWPMLAIAAVVFAAGVVVALALPPIYRSTGMVLVESQEIPHELIRSTAGSYVARRIDALSRNVMTRANLLEVIEKHDLYAESRGRQPAETVVARMRDSIELKTISGDGSKAGKKKGGEAVAFELSFEYGDPVVAQRVTGELISMFISENAKQRTRKASEATSFLQREVERLEGQLADIEGEIAEFKQKNVGKLPELAQMNLRNIEGTRRTLDSISRELRSLEERRYYLQGQLAQTKKHAAVRADDGRVVLEREDRLRILRNEYESALSLYDSSHPDVRRLKREIEMLERERGQGGSVRARRAPDNPVYISLQAQLRAVNSDINALRAQREKLQATIAEYERKLQATPQVEREYTTLLRDRDNILKSYQETRAKLRRAQLAEEMEQESKGERLTVLESPQLPGAPVKPNRPAIMFLGLLLSLACAVAYAAIAEALSSTINGRRDLTKMLGEPPLGVVPYIKVK